MEIGIKKNRGVNGKVKTYKARLIATSYHHKPSFDHKETFSLEVILKFIKVLSFMMPFNYEI